jgi:nucleoid-associated protein YgaU
MHRTAQLVKSLLALAGVLAVLLAVPAALVTLVGWPLPTVWPDLQSVTRLGQTGVSDTFVINTLTVIVWIAWTQLALALLVETVAAVRRHPARTLALLPGLQPVAARLVAAIMVFSVLTQPRTSFAGTPLEATLVTAIAPIEVATDEPTVAPVRAVTRPAARPTTTVTVGARDSWWQLAERHLGQGLRWREIRDLNLDRRVADDIVLGADTEHLEPGWQLLVPVADRPTAERTPAETVPAADGAEPHDSSSQAAVWEVTDGDQFWAIAETVLTTAWERAPTDTEISSYWQQLVDANRDALLPPHDPDLIYPGQHFTIPPPPTDPAATPSPRTSPRPPSDAAPTIDDAQDSLEPPAPPDEQQPADSDRPRGSWSTALEGAVQDRPAHPGPEASTPAGPRREVSGVNGWQAALERDRPSSAVDPDLDAAGSTTLAGTRRLLPGVAATALTAAGALALLRRRRRAALQQRPAGYRLPTPAPDTADELGRLEAAAPTEQVLDDLVELLSSIPEGVQPAIATTADRRVTLLFDDTSPLPDPPPPWSLHRQGEDDPAGWRATLGAAGPARSFGLPLLVTLGQTGAATVLANLGAIGTLQVTGPDAAVRRVLRTISLELATSRTAGPVDVVVAGDPMFATLEDVRHVDDLGAEVETAIAEGAHGVVLADRLPRLLVCHAGTSAPALPDEGVDGLVGVITATRPADAGWALAVDDDHNGRLRLPDGGHVQLTLPAVQPEVIDAELARLEQLEPPDDTPTPPETTEEADPAAVVDAPAAHPAGTSSNREPPSPRSPIEPAWCEVRLLGPIEVVRDGATLTDLSPLLRQVLLYLATHREGVTAEQLDDAVWAGRLAPPGSQRLRAALTKLREALGTGPDGQPLLPRRPNAGSPVRLSSHVGSDLDRALAHLARARDCPDRIAAADEIAAALTMVRGEPFEGLPLSWASEVTQHATAQLQDAAIAAAQTYRQGGRHGQAEDIIRRGLRLCDPCEPLYIQWAQLEAARGRRDQIPNLRRRLRARYAAEADDTAGWVATPTPETELAFETLMSDV